MSNAQKLTYFRADGHYHCVGDAHGNYRGTPAEIYQQVGDCIRSGRIGYPYVLVEVMGQKPFICTAETRANGEPSPLGTAQDALLRLSQEDRVRFAEWLAGWYLIATEVRENQSRRAYNAANRDGRLGPVAPPLPPGPGPVA